MDKECSKSISSVKTISSQISRGKLKEIVVGRYEKEYLHQKKLLQQIKLIIDEYFNQDKVSVEALRNMKQKIKQLVTSRKAPNQQQSREAKIFFTNANNSLVLPPITQNSQALSAVRQNALTDRNAKSQKIKPTVPQLQQPQDLATLQQDDAGNIKIDENGADGNAPQSVNIPQNMILSELVPGMQGVQGGDKPMEGAPANGTAPIEATDFQIFEKVEEKKESAEQPAARGSQQINDSDNASQLPNQNEWEEILRFDYEQYVREKNQKLANKLQS